MVEQGRHGGVTHCPFWFPPPKNQLSPESRLFDSPLFLFEASGQLDGRADSDYH